MLGRFFPLIVLLAGSVVAEPPNTLAVMAEADRMGAADLWPGFDPRRIPVEIFDGERTLLFHHPSPPADFQAVPGQQGVQAFAGRHPTVTANSSVELGGVSTATVMPGDANVSTTRRAEPGWRLVISAPGAPLFPKGFDPWNVQIVAPGEVLHARFIELGSDAGRIEVIGRASLTQAAGEHPLFNGVRTLTVTGLAAEPVIDEKEGAVKIQADGLQVDLKGGKIERAGQVVTVKLPG
jgi:hypothetical protein